MAQAIPVWRGTERIKLSFRGRCGGVPAVGVAALRPLDKLGDLISVEEQAEGSEGDSSPFFILKFLSLRPKQTVTRSFDYASSMLRSG